MADEKYRKSHSSSPHFEILAEIDELSNLLNDLRARMRSDRRMLRGGGIETARAA